MVNPALAKASTRVSGGRDLRGIKAQAEGLVELGQSLVLMSTADGGKVGTVLWPLAHTPGWGWLLPMPGILP